MNSSIAQEIQRKFRRRKIEYLALISVQAFFVGAFHNLLRPVLCLGLVVSTCGMCWTLTQYRQKRGTLPEVNKVRVIVDTLEALFLMLFLTLFSIAALKMDIDLRVYYAHVSVMLLSFFAATLATEMFWIRRIFPLLNSAQQLNYAVNLHASVLWPFSLSYLKKSLRWKKGS